MSAYDELHQRHLAVARRTARIVADSDDEADAIVTDAFERIRRHVTDGPIPALPFAIHVRTVIRRIALDRYRAGGGPARSTAHSSAGELAATGTDRGPDEDADDTVIDDDAAGAGPPVGPRLDAAPGDDETGRMSERQLVRAAYEALPERWQRVLWRSEVEEQTPAALAPELGSSPNSVAALAFRAREGLRQAYLAVNHATAGDDRCRPLITRLAGYVRQTLPEAEDVAVAVHLDTCAACRARREELLLLVSDLRALLVAALIGTVPPSRPAAAAAPAGVGAPVAVAALAPGVAARRPRARSRRVIQIAATTLVSAAAAVGVAFAVVTSMSPARPPEDALVAPAPTAPAYEPATSSMTNPGSGAERPPMPTVEQDEEDGGGDEGDDVLDDETGADGGDGDPATVRPPGALRPPTQPASETPVGGSQTDAPESGTTATAQPSGPPTSTPAGTPSRRSSQPAPSDPPSDPPSGRPAAPPANEPPDDGDAAEPPPASGETPGPEQTGLCVVLPIPLLCP